MSSNKRASDDGHSISAKVQDYFGKLEQERNQMADELELLRRHNSDLEKNAAVAESRAERAELERDRAIAQRDDLGRKLVALTTLWSTLESAIGQGRELVAQTVAAMRPAPQLLGSPGRDRDRGNGERRPLPQSEFDAELAKIADGLKGQSKPEPQPQ